MELGFVGIVVPALHVRLYPEGDLLGFLYNLAIDVDEQSLRVTE